VVFVSKDAERASYDDGAGPLLDVWCGPERWVLRPAREITFLFPAFPAKGLGCGVAVRRAARSGPWSPCTAACVVVEDRLTGFSDLTPSWSPIRS